MKKTSQRSLLFRQNVGRTEEEWAHFLDGYRQCALTSAGFWAGGRGGDEALARTRGGCLHRPWGNRGKNEVRSGAWHHRFHIHVFIFLEEGREMSEGEILARVNALYRRSEIVKLHKAAISASRGTSRRHCRRSPSRRCSATGSCARDARFWREQKFGIYSKAYTEGSDPF